MISLLKDFETHFHRYLKPTQFQTLSILIGLLNQYKQVKKLEENPEEIQIRLTNYELIVDTQEQEIKRSLVVCQV